MCQDGDRRMSRSARAHPEAAPGASLKSGRLTHSSHVPASQTTSSPASENA